MKFSRCSLLAAGLAVALFPCSGCLNTPDTQKPATTANSSSGKPKKIVTTLADQNGDIAFQSFVNRLRQAVAAKDLDALASLMTSKFGYHLDPMMEGDGVFAYWDQNNIWPELQLVVKEPFVPFGNNFMVAPPEFSSATDYTGYRAGIQLVNGAWKFAYFVNGS